MKLRFSPTSPFVRKVRVCAIERGLEDVIELVPTDVHDPGTDIHRDNPLGKVPALITDEGLALYDSRVICEYLDGLGDAPPLFPAAGPRRLLALRQQALGDGILDAAVLRMLEGRRRPEALRWAAWDKRQATKVQRALERLEAELNELQGPLTIGHVTAACALGYLDFRFAEEDWRPQAPGLAAWYEEIAARPSLQATRPPA